MNCKSLVPPFSYGTVMLRYRDFSKAEELRHSGYKVVPNAGWNFTWMGGVDRILTKVRAFAHQELNQPHFTDPARIQELIESGNYLFGNTNKLKFVLLDETFPRYVLQHPGKFSNWIKPL